MRLLFIEDEDAQFRTVELDLKKAAASEPTCQIVVNIEKAATLAEADFRLREPSWDAVLLDLTLATGIWNEQVVPPSSAEETLCWLNDRAATLPPVVVVTGSLLYNIRSQCFAAGATRFLFKDSLRRWPLNSLQTIQDAVYHHAAIRKRYAR